MSAQARPDVPQAGPGLPSARPDPALALRALGLMGRWTRLARGHIGIASHIACACVLPFSSIPVAQIEEDLIDYLDDRHRAAPAAVAVLARARESGAAPSLAALVRAIADAAAREAGTALAVLLDDIDTWLTGIEKMMPER